MEYFAIDVAANCKFLVIRTRQNQIPSIIPLDCVYTTLKQQAKFITRRTYRKSETLNYLYELVFFWISTDVVTSICYLHIKLRWKFVKVFKPRRTTGIKKKECINGTGYGTIQIYSNIRIKLRIQNCLEHLQ